MWFCILPVAMLRKPCRGGRAGRGQIARQFNTLSQGDWGGVIKIWERDRERERREMEQRTERAKPSNEEQAVKLTREVLSLIQDRGKKSKGPEKGYLIWSSKT